MATISSNPAIIGYPMVGVISYADSAIGEKSTGQIYMMLTDLDIPEKDLKVQNKLALLFSAAQYKNCSDPMEPTCSRVMMTGQMVRMEPGTEEYDFGLNAMLSRHPVAAAWDMRELELGNASMFEVKHIYYYPQNTTSTWPKWTSNTS